MLIQIPCTQIPQFWEIIKFSALSSDNVKEEFVNSYCLTLLQDLLSGKKLCFIAKNDSKVTLVVIMSFYNDRLTDSLGMNVDNIYAFAVHNADEWKAVVSDAINVAVKAECKIITAESSNRRVGEILKESGVNLISTKYTYYI